MAYDYSDLVEKTKRWAEQAGASGWIQADSAAGLTDFEIRMPDALFDQGQSRPLIVAFMGGTGVGKSSLLNRLAGTAIARTGIERPTSREVTLFHHQAVPIRHLPEKLPIASIKIAQHQDDAKKNIIWIDMPDFDSTDQGNKHLVLEWLPHIDVLIYVVSPERYRDDKAWRLLLAEGGRHAWLFALNQWDRGRPEQYEDLKRQLNKAGFAEPIIFRTVCAEDLQADEFAALASTITSLATEHTIMQLEQRGLQVRKAELKRKLEDYRQSLGDESMLQQAPDAWRQQWLHTAGILQQGFAWPLQQLANYYAEQAGELLAKPAAGKYPANRPDLVLWDSWAAARMDDALDEFIIHIDNLGIPVVPVKNQLSALQEKAPKIIETETGLAVRQALANPGNALQRALLKGVRIGEIILPLAAIAWVGYRVFTVFYRSNIANADYLGVDFAIHGTLLIAISWLTPWFILKKLKPSLKNSALRGLNKGLISALSMIDGEVAAVLATIRHQHAQQVQQISDIINQCGTDSSQSQPIDDNSTLARMLID